MKSISVLGSTGSIGVNTLSVVREAHGAFRIVALAAGRNISLLSEQMQEFQPMLVVVIDESHARALKKLVGKGFGGDILYGATGYEEAASIAQADMVVAAMVGAAGLAPTLAAIEAGKDVALANKEVLVMAGQIVMGLVERRGVCLLPIDSEHNAIFQCLNGEDKGGVSRLILTASGGPFLHHSPEELERISPAQALQHPRWKMGKKVSVDSATLMNKGLELIEARWLFGFTRERLAVLIHPQSIVHSLVEFCDGSILAQLGVTDMRLPIAYTLNYPQRVASSCPFLDLPSAGALEFFAPDVQRFPCLSLAQEALQRGGLMPAILNAANEEAVELFLAGKLAFGQIPKLVAAVMERLDNKQNPTLEEVLGGDARARAEAKSIFFTKFVSTTANDDPQ